MKHRSIVSTMALALLCAGLSATASAARLPNTNTLTIAPGTASSTSCLSGSCFSMEVVTGFTIWTAILPGTDGGLVLGKNQTSGGQQTGADSATNTTSGQITAAWFFFGNYGTFATAPFTGTVSGAVTTDSSYNYFDSASCSLVGCAGLSQLGTLNVAWGGRAVPMGSAFGCVSSKCTANQLNGIFISEWTVNADNSYMLRYSQVVPTGDPSGFGDVPFGLIMTGNITAANVPPTANAGVDQSVFSGATVTLTGTCSDTDGTIASCVWTQTAGPAVTLSGSGSTVSFTAPSVTATTTLSFQLTATDNGGAKGSDLMNVTVNAVGNVPPTANAGSDQTVTSGNLVSMSGSGTDTDGTIASYAWTQTAGPAVTLSGASSATATFTAPTVTTATTLTFQLTVTDNGGASATDSVNVTVNSILCTDTYPLITVPGILGGGQSPSVNGTLTSTWTGHIGPNNAKNSGSVCANTDLVYDVQTTVGTATCTLDGTPVASSGVIRLGIVGRKLVCTNKPAGSDIDRYVIKVIL